MNIAIFTDSFLPGIGGTENAVLRYAIALSETDNVLVVAPDYHAETQDEKYPFKVVRVKSVKLTSNDMWAMPALTKGLTETLDEFSPNVLHCQHWGMISGFANSYAKKRRLPLVYIIHTKFLYCYKRSFGAYSPIPYLMVKNGVRRLKKADLVCAVSNSMAKELFDYGYKKPITVIRNGFNAKDIRELAEDSSIKTKNGVFKFLYVGYVISYKNIAFTLKALRAVKAVRDDFIFQIAGKGPDFNKFVKLAEKYGLKNNVKFLGAITDKKALSALYASSDLLLFPSIFDSDGLTVLEAAYYGTPALVIKGAGASERITDGETGFTSENSETAFAQKTLSLMDDRSLLKNVGENAKNIYSSWDETVKEYKAVYASLLGQNGDSVSE